MERLFERVMQGAREGECVDRVCEGIRADVREDVVMG